MATYLELKQQAEKLMQEAEELRSAELQSVIADIRGKIAAYGLTPEDLGFKPQRARKQGRPAKAEKPAAKSRRKPRTTTAAGKKAGKPKSQAPVKYRGPNGETWSGGRGRKPAWVQAVLQEGGNIEAYAV